MQGIIKVRNREMKRLRLFTYLLVAVSILIFFYQAYKYLFYSADCNPINNMSLNANSFINMIGLGCAYQFWLVPIVAYFWPTSQRSSNEIVYKRARKRFDSFYTTESSHVRHSGSTINPCEGDFDDDYGSEDNTDTGI